MTTTHERRLDQAERRIDMQDNGARMLSERIIRIEANTDNITSALRRIEASVAREK